MDDEPDPAIDRSISNRIASHILVCCVVLTLAGLVMYPFNWTSGLIVWLLGMGGGVLFSLVRWHAITTAYRCSECGTAFDVSILQDLLSIHLPRRSYTRCPACGRRSWAMNLIVVDG